jgi:hypothetical protein
MVLHPGGCGRVGHRRNTIQVEDPNHQVGVLPHLTPKHAQGPALPAARPRGTGPPPDPGICAQPGPGYGRREHRSQGPPRAPLGSRAAGRGIHSARRRRLCQGPTVAADQDLGAGPQLAAPRLAIRRRKVRRWGPRRIPRKRRRRGGFRSRRNLTAIGADSSDFPQKTPKTRGICHL